MTRYRGRFAPSPTGPLHQGSLVAALASYLDARAQGGEWLVRIEDVDVTRTVPGSAGDILRCLEACGLEWDGSVVYQTARFPAYEAALARLSRHGATYLCGCSRKELDGGRVYPGTCRDGIPDGLPARLTRLRIPVGSTITFTDLLLGLQTQDVAQQCGDFPLFRADGIWAYQLAVVADDDWQGITHVVRGEDLLDSTARQILLQRLLGLPQPAYAHIPVVVDADGQKLSKQTKAPAVDRLRPGHALTEALSFLNQPVPDGLAGAPVPEILAHAIRHWRLCAAAAVH